MPALVILVDIGKLPQEAVGVGERRRGRQVLRDGRRQGVAQPPKVVVEVVGVVVGALTEKNGALHDILEYGCLFAVGVGGCSDTEVSDCVFSVGMETVAGNGETGYGCIIDEIGGCGRVALVGFACRGGTDSAPIAPFLFCGALVGGIVAVLAFGKGLHRGYGQGTCAVGGNRLPCAYGTAVVVVFGVGDDVGALR